MVTNSEELNLGKNYSEVIGQTLSLPYFTRLLIAGRVDKGNGEAAIMAFESAKRAIVKKKRDAHITGSIHNNTYYNMVFRSSDITILSFCNMMTHFVLL